MFGPTQAPFNRLFAGMTRIASLSLAVYQTYSSAVTAIEMSGMLTFYFRNGATYLMMDDDRAQAIIATHAANEPSAMLERHWLLILQASFRPRGLWWPAHSMKLLCNSRIGAYFAGPKTKPQPLNFPDSLTRV